MSTIVNSAASNSIFSILGTAIALQPNNKTTTILGGSGSVSGGNSISAGNNSKTAPSTASKSLIGYLDLINVAEPGIDVSNANGSSEIEFDNPEFFEKGDFVLTDKGFVFQVVSQTGTDTTVTINAPFAQRTQFFTDFNNTPLKRIPKNTFNSARAAKYIYIGTDEIGGSSNAALTSGSTTPNRDLNNATTIRTHRYGAAIRSGHWNEYAGEWTTEPSVANDTSIINPASDKAFADTGRTTYYSFNAPTSQDL